MNKVKQGSCLHKTRFKDKNNKSIYLGDVVHVEEYPDEFVGGALDYEGVIEEENSKICAVYYDIGERQSTPLSAFPKREREVITQHTPKMKGTDEDDTKRTP